VFLTLLGGAGWLNVRVAPAFTVGAIRVTFWGPLAMAVTAGVGGALRSRCVTEANPGAQVVATSGSEHPLGSMPRLLRGHRRQRREIRHFGVTRHPTSEWVVQQLREAFPEIGPLRCLVLDHDATRRGANAPGEVGTGITSLVVSGTGACPVTDTASREPELSASESAPVNVP
jgi:hypothetical protein